MAATGLRGPVYNARDGSKVVTQHFRAVLTDITEVPFTRIQATERNPVMVEAQIYVATTTEAGVISIGTAGAPSELFNETTIDTADTFLPASNATAKFLYETDTTLVYLANNDSVGAVVDIILTLATFDASTDTGL